MSGVIRISRLFRLGQTALNSNRQVLIRNGQDRLSNSRNDRAASISFTRFQSTNPEPKDDTYRTIIKDTEKPTGESTTHEFKAETRMLLDIVAKSLYSEKEVFVRELISNASDALEKFRYTLLSGGELLDKMHAKDRSLEIHISTDKQARTLTIQDTGIGMTKDDLMSNLGIIARSGSKAFLEELKKKTATGNNTEKVIGQFGVGFYSSFMVAEKVEVYSKAATDEQGYRWVSDGSGTYDIQPAEGVQLGTKIVIHLKVDCREFADEDTVRNIIKKYSNFVGSPIYLNGKKENTVQPLWLCDPKQITAQQHMEFYRYVGNSYDLPRYTLHYNTEVPLSIHALLYFPEGKPVIKTSNSDQVITLVLYSIHDRESTWYALEI